MSSTRNWFRLPIVYRARAERRESPALAAFHWDGSTPRQSDVANISNSGAFLRTKEQWKVGEMLSLTLQRSGVLENSPQRRFTVQAKSVRRDREGVGVEFVLPRGSDLRLWQSAIKAEVSQTEPEDVVREFRISAALAFIHRIAPEATAQARLLLREGLSNFRLDGAVEIALHAEELLGLESNSSAKRAHPSLVLRILDDGSWAEAEWVQHYWAGVLATSCNVGRPAPLDLTHVSLLSQLTTIQARIFRGACTRASRFVGHDGRVYAHRLTCSAEELVQMADTHDRVHIDRDVQHLMELGLIERQVKWKFFDLIESADVTPTPLAFELHARCLAHRGSVAEVQGAVTAPTPCYAAD